MTAAISSPAYREVNPATVALKESASIRKIKAELHEIEKQLNYSGLKDDTTNLLRLWHKNFRRSLDRDGNAERAIGEFIAQLQNILIDPIPRIVDPQTTALLDDKPLLGSDGRTYGFRSLTIFFSSDGINSNRSPFNQSDATPFTAKPHPVAAHMVSWLKKFKGYIPSPEIDRAFQEMMAEGRAAGIPSPVPLAQNREERIRSLVADQARREREEHKAEHKAREEVENGVAAPFDRMQQIAQEMLDQFLEDRAEDADAIAAIQRDAEELNVQIEALEKELQELQNRIDGVRGSIREIDKQNAELDRDLKEVKKAILEREKSWVKGLVITAAIIAACVIANQYLLPALASSSSASVKALPLPFGAKVTGSIKL